MPIHSYCYTYVIVSLLSSQEHTYTHEQAKGELGCGYLAETAHHTPH